MRTLKLNWGDQAILPNGQILQPKMLTPEESRDLNEKHMPLYQRKCNDIKAESYKQHMIDGTWDNNNMSVLRLSPNGDILDGGHRTRAAALANFTLVSVLIKNVPENTYISTDIGKVRKSSDFISGTDEVMLNSLARSFMTANRGFSAVYVKGNGTVAKYAYDANDPAAFLCANRAEIEEYVAIASRMRSRCKDTIRGRLWGVVAAIARVKSGNDTWINSISNTSNCIVEIKDYIADAQKHHIAQAMQDVWVFCRLMADFREKCFRGRKWNVRQIAQIQEEFSRALKGHFRNPRPSDYKKAAEDYLKYAHLRSERKAAREAK